MRAPKGYPPQSGVCMGSGTITQVYIVYKWQNTNQSSQINKEGSGDYWFMRRHGVNCLQAWLNPRAQITSKNISLCLFSFISLFLHPSALLSSVLDLLSHRLFTHVGKDGQQQLQARFVCVTVTPVEREILSPNKSSENPKDESHWPLWNDMSIQNQPRWWGGWNTPIGQAHPWRQRPIPEPCG